MGCGSSREVGGDIFIGGIRYKGIFLGETKPSTFIEGERIIGRFREVGTFVSHWGKKAWLQRGEVFWKNQKIFDSGYESSIKYAETFIDFTWRDSWSTRRGIICYWNGLKFDGIFKGEHFEGEITDLSDPSKGIFNGSGSQDVWKGTRDYPDGTIEKGIFKFRKLVQGKKTFPNGEIQKGSFEEGRLKNGRQITKAQNILSAESIRIFKNFEPIN